MTTSEKHTLPLGLEQKWPSMRCRKALCLQVYTHAKEWPGGELLSEP